jgi:hypothetical protein
MTGGYRVRDSNPLFQSTATLSSTPLRADLYYIPQITLSEYPDTEDHNRKLI